MQRMPRLQSVGAALLVGLLALPCVTAGEESAVPRVDFTYTGPSAFQGRFTGVCDSHGFSLSNVGDRSIVMDAQGGAITVRRTLVNETSALSSVYPVAIPPSAQMWPATSELPAGPLRIDWAADGLVVGWPSLRAGATGEPLTAELALDHANLTSLQAGRLTPAETLWLAGAEGPSLGLSQYPGWSRIVRGTQPTSLHGGLTLYLRHATVTAPETSMPLPPYAAERSNVTTPAATRRTVEFTDALVHLPSVRLGLPASATLTCGALDGFLEGNFVAAQATGSARRALEALTFEDRALSLQGSFRMAETPQDRPLVSGATGRISTTAEGDVRAVGLDFAPALASVVPPLVPALSAGLLALLAAIVLSKNAGALVGVFYSRFGRDAALSNANRGLLYDAITQNPGADLTQLARLASLHLTTVGYHVDVLRRVGLVTTHRRGRSVHVLLPSSTLQRALPTALAARDERYAYVLDRLRMGPTTQLDLAKGLRDRFSITIRGAYMVIERAANAGVVERIESSQGVMLRCPVPAASS